MTGVLKLSPVEFLACWYRLDLGEPPPPLELRPPGHTINDRDRHLSTALEHLARRRLADNQGPVPALADTLRRLAGAHYRLDIRVGTEQGHQLGLGALTAARGMTLQTTGGELALTAMDGSAVARHLLVLAGNITPGIGDPVNIPAAALKEACRVVPCGDPWATADALRARGVQPREANSLARMCTGVQISGQLGATCFLGERPRRGAWVVAFHRTNSGWYSLVSRDGTISVSPTDTNQLMRAWRALVEAFRTTA